MKKQKHVWQIVYCVCFLTIISMAGILVIQKSARPVYKVLQQSNPGTPTQTVRSIEACINRSLQGRSKLVDLYGLSQRVLGKWQVGHVVRDRDKMLHMMNTIPAEKTLLEYSKNLISLEQAATRRKIPFLYAQAPSDLLAEKTRLPYGMGNVSNQRIDFFLHQLDQAGVPVLDTRILFEHWKPREVFYATDHHWTTAAAFAAMGEILSRLNALYGMNLDPDQTVRDLEHYFVRSFPDSFLGSRGVRVGQFFAGKDDFSYYEPSFETNLQLQYFKKSVIVLEKNGAFSEALIDPTSLSPNYKNKYNAFLYAQNNELRITNKMGKGRGKCLIIADSFARCMVPYLSLCFEQTALLDPQPGRYRENYVDYIDVFRPDVIVVLFNGLGVYTEVPAEDPELLYRAALGQTQNPQVLYESLLASLVDTSSQQAISNSLTALFEKGSHQEIAKILLSETRRYQRTKDPKAELFILYACEWLISNAYYSQNGSPGFGLSQEWDAGSDGSINPASTSYGIEVANISYALLSVLEADIIPQALCDDLTSILKEIALAWCDQYWTECDVGGFFWYSDQPGDASEYANISAELAGSFAMLLHNHSDLFTEEEYALMIRYRKFRRIKMEVAFPVC